ncbi:hypothetical protein [Priestia aryabhattai]|uniref:hypothetical protein n=1 Tax=Priestia aryabhattai TaxID=412384 RepID=UPI002E1B22B9|nr:hypothetical protein [Priestia aryabhattai]
MELTDKQRRTAERNRLKREQIRKKKEANKDKRELKEKEKALHNLNTINNKVKPLSGKNKRNKDKTDSGECYQVGMSKENSKWEAKRNKLSHERTWLGWHNE